MSKHNSDVIPSHVPVYERALGIRQIEFVIQARQRLGDGGDLAEHAHGARNLSQVTGAASSSVYMHSYKVSELMMMAGAHTQQRSVLVVTSRVKQ